MREDVNVTGGEITNVGVPGGTITEAGLRINVNVALQYINCLAHRQRRGRDP